MMIKQMGVQTVNEPAEELQMVEERMEKDDESKEKEHKAIQACVAFYHFFNPYNNDMVYLDFII